MTLLNKWRKRSSETGDQPGHARARGTGKDWDWSLSRLRREMDRTLYRLWRDFGRPRQEMAERAMHIGEWPALDVAEDDCAVTVRADVPGLEANDLDIIVSGNRLTISGTRQDEWSQLKGGVYRRERRSGSFDRTITLPSCIDASRVEASYDKGTLTITAPKVPSLGTNAEAPLSRKRLEPACGA